MGSARKHHLFQLVVSIEHIAVVGKRGQACAKRYLCHFPAFAKGTTFYRLHGIWQCQALKRQTVVETLLRDIGDG